MINRVNTEHGMKPENGFYWLQYERPTELNVITGLYFVEWDYNSLGDVRIKPVDDFHHVINFKWIHKYIAVINPFI